MREYKNFLIANNRAEFREWLYLNASSEAECWLCLKRGQPKDDGAFYYLDAVEEALCFGWIDSTLATVDGKKAQRFSPRRSDGNWTELNKERVRRLEKLGLMTDLGRAVLPDMEKEYVISSEFVNMMKAEDIYDAFLSFPPLYRRIRAYNLAFYKGLDEAQFSCAWQNFVKNTKQGKTYGNWNDYGRLTNY